MLCFSLGDIFANLSISCGYRSRFIALLDYLKPCFCKLFVFDEESRLSMQKTLSILQESGDKQTTVRHQTSNRVLPQSLKYIFFCCCTIKSWGSKVSPSPTLIFNRSYKFTRFTLYNVILHIARNFLEPGKTSKFRPIHSTI